MLTTFDDIVSYVDVKVIKKADYNFFICISHKKSSTMFLL